MLKKLVLTTAISALMISGAMAQSTSSGASTSGASMPSAAALPVNQQKPDQWLASKFSGTDVIGDDNQKIGDVTDILFDKSGKIEAYIVSVGGFLGIGSKNVALAPTSFQVMPADHSGGGTSYDRLKLSMTKDQLQKMASFEPYSPPRPQTTGQGSGQGSGLGGSGGMATRPSTNTPPASAK